MPAERLEQPHDVAAHERLAAGDAQLLHAALDKRRAETVELLQREQVAARQERHVLRHAVDTPEVAAVGDGHPQVGDVAAVAVAQALPGQHFYPITHRRVLFLVEFELQFAARAEGRRKPGLPLS